MSRLFGSFLLVLLATVVGRADMPDEFRVKREAEYGFTREPALEFDGDEVRVRFETEAACDVTVAIENGKGEIVRHLACGVLGANAPAPFDKNTLSQSLVWDGKDDQGRYIDDRIGYTVRVSLGLKPRFEKSLLWEPRRRLGSWMGSTTFVNMAAPLMQATEEGVYVFEGRGVDQLRLFDRDGEYVRTIYPFPADRIGDVDGIDYQSYPQDGKKLPHKRGFLQSTFLTSGSTGQKEAREDAMYGSAASSMAVRGAKIALAQNRQVNRLATDGSTGGLALAGGNVTFPARLWSTNRPETTERIGPTRMAFSPDGKWLYLAGYQFREYGGHHVIKDTLPGVARLEFAADEPAEPFLGSMKQGEFGSEPGEFHYATSVDVDAQGRIYVSDYMNDRVQVFNPEGEFLKAISTFKPALVRVHRRSGEIYVFSWTLHDMSGLGRDEKTRKIVVEPKLRTYGSFENPKPRRVYELPFREGPRGWLRYREKFHSNNHWGGLEFSAELDSWSDPPRIWLVAGQPDRGRSAQKYEYIRIFELKEEELVLVRDFAEDVQKSIGKFVLPQYWRQRLYVNPATGLLYVAEQHTAAREKAFRELIEVDPETGRTQIVQLPFDAEDLAFGPDGTIFLRERITIGHYHFPSWREIPWDYGEQFREVSCDVSQGRRTADLLSGLPIYTGTGWHTGGLAVSVSGHLAVSCYVTKGDVPAPVAFRTDEKTLDRGGIANAAPDKGEFRTIRGRYFRPTFYPGRTYFGEIHIFDEHGRVLREDVVRGLNDIYGLGIGRDDSVTVLASPTRIYDGKRYFNEMSGTLLKFPPGEGKIVTSSKSAIVPIPITNPKTLDGEPTARKGTTNFWIQGADWMYGGVGFCGKNATYAGGGCSCWNTRFAMDYFGRSFAPEIDRYRVAVLDSAGNLILRVGQYGNVDSAGPDSLVPLGGDEVGLFHAPYVTTHTDKRLFIADVGNQRIASVHLGYHLERELPLENPR